ncbi:type VII secretion integral membrane protein EccD [uncultured Nocardioides sp.]|uniref:type VII secretion integral membrane protein EccD n=1 Tax=uncultured Nocardioides sp. TaxID=198441 RepID=UPI00261C22D1|nr:type VII secretion integral membrane protein EccD [uncultured Nocardioides sp.]
MSQSTTTSGLVRVTVASGTRRVDLVLPGSVPVAELLPELARSVGLLDPATVYGGYKVVTQEGRELGPDTGLTVQGVEDGGLLTVSAGVDEEPPRVYDDVVEAMADVVERDLKPWEPAAGRRTALASALLLLGLGAAALLVQGDALVAGVAATVIAALLVTGAVVLSRVRHEPQAAVALAAMSAVYAAVAGLLYAPAAALFTLPLACAGAGALVAGVIAVVGIDEGRALAIPAVVVGALAAAGGLLIDYLGLEAPVVFTALLVLVVILGSVFPWLALGATSTQVDQAFTLADVTRDPDEIDPEKVGTDARLAHEILLAVSATVGLLLVLVAPLAVSLGVTGTLLAIMSCAVVMLRTRQYRTGSEVLVGLAAGVTGLLTVAVSVLLMHESWRPLAAVALAVTGAVLVAATLVPASASVRRGRLGDLAETISLVSLVPLAVFATGLFDLVGG